MKISNIEQSRQQWKAKAKERGAKIRNLRKTAKRLKTKPTRNPWPAADHPSIRCLKEENAAQRAGLGENNRPALEASSPALPDRMLCVTLIIGAVTPFRCVPRILVLVQPWLRFQVKIPHFTSVIHWTLRVGIALFRQVSVLSEPWVALLDCSIDIGTRKALVVLRVPLKALHQKQNALGLQDCECIGLEISSSWNGPRVAETLAHVFEKSGLSRSGPQGRGNGSQKGSRTLLWTAAGKTDF